MTATKAQRQVCRKCLKSCTPVVTLTFDGGTRRLHWCSDCASDAEKYDAPTATAAKCKHCRRPIVSGPNGWYHRDTEAARCRDDASFTYAEPKSVTR